MRQQHDRHGQQGHGQHGRGGRHHRRTNFAKHNHEHLYQMLYDGDESTARAAADSWDGVGARMHEQAGNLESKLGTFREQWTGGAAEQYQLMITDLGRGLRRIGDAMFTMRDVATNAADALVKAKSQMPPPVAVPDVSSATMYLATTPVEVDPMASVQEVAALRARQADAVAEFDGYQQAVGAANSAYGRAVQVMTNLATDYVTEDDVIPIAPTSASRTGLGPGEEQDDSELVLPDDETDPSQNGNGTPVFGVMFTAGVAAAAAATAGRLGRILPKVPDWAKKDDKAKEDKKKGGTDKLTGGGLSGGKLGGIGGGLGGGAGGNLPTPIAHTGMVGGQVAGAAGALRAAAGAAGAGAAMMPMMPFMPMAPMGMEGANARRIPPWLTETEDVWGESSVITPPVLGEEQPEERRRPDFLY
ncbi:WXG100 family type VII secretion target [Actinophytocola oryzae]|uniref:PPE family protein n=1 Tax=Actinophytocola oryzae TaxID=502181 RepID=A0A4R7VZA2_9PSEU|nr:WXG100 family type VII secretion target [Actinophytocola oryzae]TDV54998.1 PPE family protein [Actinophytocola oryzae]